MKTERNRTPPTSAVEGSDLTLPYLLILSNPKLAASAIYRHMELKHTPALNVADGFNYGSNKNPIWVFELTGKKQNVLSFYKQSISILVWKLIEETPTCPRYKQEGKLLTIAHRNTPGKDIFSPMTEK